jgi:hypothetical protein
VLFESECAFVLFEVSIEEGDKDDTDFLLSIKFNEEFVGVVA